MVLSLLSSPALALNFPDVGKSSDYFEAISYVSDRGLMVGDNHGNFNPGKTVTRAEMATIVCRMLGETNGLAKSEVFSDVPADHWANGYVCKAAELGIVNGYGNGKFGPSDNVTYEQAVTMIVRSLGEENRALSAGGYPAGYMSVVQKDSLLSGISAKEHEALSRGNVAKLLFNYCTEYTEIKKAVDLGFVSETLQGDYNSQISYAGFCSILDRFISAISPASLDGWKAASKNYRDADVPMSRMEGALVLLYAAECCGVDAVGYEYNIPLEDLMPDNVNFYEGVTWDYPLLPDIHAPYYNETLANSEHYAWRCGLDYADNASKRFVEYMSYGNGKTYFDYDERYSLNLGSAFTRGDAIRAVERLYENARFVQYVPAAGVSCTVSDAAIASGGKLPEVSPQQLPEWRGYSVSPGNWNVGYGGGMLYEKEWIEVLRSQGFNFVRVPLDSRMIFKDSDMSLVNPAYLETMDDLIEYCAEAGIHVCFDLHDMPGFYTGGDDSQITLWNDEKTQGIFVEFWRFLAEYYKDVPTNLLSFNLLNEPHSMDGGPSDAVYSAIMLKAIDAIRKVTPARLIFVDMLGVLRGIPVQGLANAQVVQTVHPYFLSDGTQQWPNYVINGFIHRNNGVLTLNGAFPAGTKITAEIVSVHGDSTFCMEADGKTAAEVALGTEAEGENGCYHIGEKGTDGEYRDYSGVHFTGKLTENCNQIKLVQEGGWWYAIEKLTVETDTYKVTVNSNGNVVGDGAVPILTFDEKGGISAQEAGTLVCQSREWLDELFRSYRKFTEETGTPVMVQEFGFNETIDYKATLAAAEDFLSVLDEYDIPWCSWCSAFGPILDKREYEWGQMSWDRDLRRNGAEYETVSGNWMIDTGLMEVYRRHMK